MGYYVCLDSKNLLIASLKGKLQRDPVRGDVVFNPEVNKALNVPTPAPMTWACFLLRVTQSQEVDEKGLSCLCVCLFWGRGLLGAKQSQRDPSTVPTKYKLSLLLSPCCVEGSSTGQQAPLLLS